jgi:hypothetical protein
MQTNQGFRGRWSDRTEGPKVALQRVQKQSSARCCVESRGYVMDNKDRLISADLWSKEILRMYQKPLLFPSSISYVPWHRRQWNMAKYRVLCIRERLGEVIAGRRFEDY